MKKVLIPILILLTAQTAAAQTNLFTLQYNMSVPTSDMSDYITATSFRGVSADWRWFNIRRSHLAAGFSLGWQVFDQSATGTFQLNNGAVTGVQKRYLNAFPMLITGYYYFSTAWRDPKIYLGGGIGAYYMLQNFDLGVNRLEASNWHFGAAPEVGLQFPAGNSQGIVNVKYNWVNESGEGIAGQERGYAYWGLNAGFAWDF